VVGSALKAPNVRPRTRPTAATAARIRHARGMRIVKARSPPNVPSHAPRDSDRASAEVASTAAAPPRSRYQRGRPERVTPSATISSIAASEPSSLGS